MSPNRNAIGKRLAMIFLALPLTTAIAATAGHRSQAKSSLPPGYSTAITGGAHDFDYFMGSGWITHQHRLKSRGTGSHEWENFKGYLCAVPYLGGIATVDELYFPSRHSAGLTVRTYNRKTRQWSIYWASSTDGKLNPIPMVGGFKDKLGLFYAADHDVGGRPIKVRFIWKIIDHDHARWEQAFSYDNHTWETNWTADFVRAKRSTVCADERPKRG